MIYLIVITLLISLIALFSVIILFIRQNRLFEIERRYNDLMKQLDESVSSFLLQMKEENESFINKFKEMQQDGSNDDLHETEINSEELNNESIVYKEPDLHIEGTPIYSGIKEYQKAIKRTTEHNQVQTSNQQVDKAENNYENDLKKINELLNAGYSIDEIAKSLNKGKTEVELIIKLSPDTF